jgi:hypothetical protein
VIAYFCFANSERIRDKFVFVAWLSFDLTSFAH